MSAHPRRALLRTPGGALICLCRSALTRLDVERLHRDGRHRRNDGGSCADA